LLNANEHIRLVYLQDLTSFLGEDAGITYARAPVEECFLNINRMKLRAFRLRQVIISKKKRREQTVEEYARLIWLINSHSEPYASEKVYH